MSDSFNGYHVWLGIPLSEQPPNHYRLLGIAIFESDLDVIDHAADRQMAHVRTFQAGRHAALSQRILNELAAARVCLLNSQRKADYDDELRSKLAAAPQVAAVPVGKAVPVAQPARVVPTTPPSAKPAVPPTAKPVGAQPSPSPAGTPVEAPRAAPTAVPVAGAAPATSTPTVDDDDDDMFGLQTPSARRPVASGGGSLFDDDDLGSGTPAVNIDLARRTTSSDVLIQKLAIYGFVAVAGLVLLMVAWNIFRRNVGPLENLFKAPVVPAPVVEKAEPAAPPAPMPNSEQVAPEGSSQPPG